MLRILVVHNRYCQQGGEDVVFRSEGTLLRRKGHYVIEFLDTNCRLKDIGHMAAAFQAIWSGSSKRRVKQTIADERPDVVHVHNTFLALSPSVYYACQEVGVPVVQTLHNYRLLCPGALFLRQGRACEDCLGKALPWPALIHRCWRGSRTQTIVPVAMLTVHRALKTWSEQVDTYIALTEFARRKFIKGGLPPEKIVVKPNFVYPDPDEGGHTEDFALFVGRLSPEKGVQTLLRAWRHLQNVPLKIVGDGPLMGEVQAFAVHEGMNNVEVLKYRPRQEVFQLMQRAQFLIFPSEWYEGFPMTVAEAFACGLPVIASRLGAVAEIVEDERTGLHFEPGNPEDLSTKVEWAWTHPIEVKQMGHEARQVYEAKYTADRNYEQLMHVYQRVMSRT